MDAQYPYEKLGLLYLGRELDLDTRESSSTPLLFKNKNLTTHAAIIGMTGSGKTGLGIGLIEEAIMDNVPSIIIDPKGDMGNLLLSFPDLKASDFEPWIDPSEAAKKGLSSGDFAKKTADTWREGLASWGQGKERIGVLRSKTDFTIYTPGSSAGIPISVLNSFHPPTQEVLKDLDTLNGLVNSTTISLLTLIDVTGDTLQSREHILVSSLLLHFWRKRKGLSLESLIGYIVNPPFEKVGVFGLDTFYPQKERMELAMQLNNILASPTFEAWTEGEPLDIQRILYTEQGKPRTAIFSIAHLNESERMFFVTMLLNQFIGWMRRQQGSSSLKALLYMDEIFGYFPPTANPPSKKPMLLLLKQARAYGIGVVLATQNPVDLDYKGLSNIGTWFIGRLQTSQDQKRVLEGIVGASQGALDKGQAKQLLANMKGRQFLLSSAHLDETLLFETRWVLSYLKGPISSSDIKKLMRETEELGMLGAQETSEGALAREVGMEAEQRPPLISGKIPQFYLLHPVTAEKITFEPWLLATSSVRFFNAKRNIDIVKSLSSRLYLDETFTKPEWERAELYEYSEDEFGEDPPENSSYYPLSSTFASYRDLRSCTKSYADHVYQSERLELFRVRSLKLESVPGESMTDFKIRMQDHLRDLKETAVEKLQEKYATRQKRLEDQIMKAQNRVEKEKVDVKSKTTDTLLSFGAAVLGAFLGRKAVSASTISKASTGVRNVGRLAKEKGEVRRAEELLVSLHEDMEELGLELEEKVMTLSERYDVDQYDVETFSIKPRRSDVYNVELALLWEMVAY